MPDPTPADRRPTGARVLPGSNSVRLLREQTERVTCGVEKDAVPIPARLMLGASRSTRQHQIFGCVEILDGEVEVELLGNLLAGPVQAPPAP